MKRRRKICCFRRVFAASGGKLIKQDSGTFPARLQSYDKRKVDFVEASSK